MLASIQQITSVENIPMADKIQVAKVLGWEVVVKKGEFQPGDLCIYIEIDTLLPRKEWSEFLFKHAPVEGVEDFHRLKTIKLRGQISQGLILPLITLGFDKETIQEGKDVSEWLGIKKYERPVAPHMRGTIKGNFPAFLRKTDEERIQSKPELIEQLRGKPYYITVKMDGTSATFFKHDGKFGVCSRNLELKNPNEPTFHEQKMPWWKLRMFLHKIGIMKSSHKGTPKVGAMNIYWQTAFNYNMENSLPDGLCIQGEICGPGIQENKMGLKEHKLFVFNVFDINQQKYVSPEILHIFDIDISRVPMFEKGDNFQYSMEELLAIADNIDYDNGTPAEGIVVRSTDQKISFKVISNRFLLHYGE